MDPSVAEDADESSMMEEGSGSSAGSHDDEDDVTSPSSSSSSDDGTTEEAETLSTKTKQQTPEEREEIENLIETLKKRISENDYDYNAHTELITLLKKSGLNYADQLKDARENMRKLFPLTEEFWLDWLRDEQITCGDDETRVKVIELFQIATADYIAPDLWVEYCTFSIGNMGTLGVDKVRSIFEKGITAIGVHISKGILLWEVYREFENAILANMQNVMVLTPEQKKAIDTQISKIDSLFRRQLSLPLLGMEETYNEYKEWVDTVVPAYVEQSYKKALNLLEKRRDFEKVLNEPPYIYRPYLTVELSGDSEPSRILCLFERAIKHHCLDTDLWIDYLKYLDQTLKISQVAVDVYYRASRNIPWEASVWEGYLRALERHKSESIKIQEVFEKALAIGFQTVSEYEQVTLCYCDYLRRVMVVDSPPDLAARDRTVEELSHVFETTISKIQTLFGAPSPALYQYWALIRCKYSCDMKTARRVWDKFLADGHVNQCHLWLEYVNFERMYGDQEHCRKLYQRAIQIVSDWPGAMCDAFLRFEREEGSLEQFDVAFRKCSSRLERVKQQRDKTVEATVLQSYDQHSQMPPPTNDTAVVPVSSRKENRPKSKQKPESKHPRKPALSQQKLPANKRRADTDDVIGMEAERRVAERPPIKRRKMDPKQEEGGIQKAETDPERSKRTVFISNIPYSITVETLTELFTGKSGPVQDIRLVTNKSGKSKGYAYVEFKSEESVVKALLLDRHVISERPMYVSPCIDKKSNPDITAHIKYPEKLERNKLFISSLAESVTKDELECLCKPFGDIKEVRVVTNRAGKRKGIAFVEFTDELSAGKAVMALDGNTLYDMSINVSISNPPKRKQPLDETRTEKESTQGSKSKQKATQQPRKQQQFRPGEISARGRSFGARGRGRTQLAWLPRALHKPSQSATQSNPSTVTCDQGDKSTSESPAVVTGDHGLTMETSNNSAEQGAKMSNDDFRNLMK